MKRTIRLFLALALVICTFSFSFVHDLHHVHAVSPGDVIGKCPNCGASNTYRIIDIMEWPTCTDKGLAYAYCSDCYYGNSGYQIPALGHNFVTTSTEAATCTENGVRHQKCSRCGATRNQNIDALGHDYNYEQIEPTCTQDGYIKGVCSRCNDETIETIAALGHDFGEYVVVKPALCEEDGLKEANCSRCSEIKSEVIPMTGHDFPEEWTIEKPAGIMKKGLESKTCRNCGQRLEQIIPAKVKPPVIITVIVTTIAAIGAAFYFKARKPKSLFKPSFETKTVLVESENEELVELLKRQVYLQVTDCASEELLEKAKEEASSIVICEVNDKDRLNSLLETAKADFPDSALGLIVSKDLLDLNRDTLNQLVDDHSIINYVSSDQGKYSVLVKLVLPVLKPDLRSDESLENFGAIADLLGIPGVSAMINVYVSGKDIKATLEEGELGVSGTASIIGDIASILGLDTVGSIAGLVSDVDDIKAALDEETGAYEVKEGVKAGKDIVDVVKDIID